MLKTKDLTELFRAIGSHDMARAATLSRKLAAQHGSQGHYRAERDLLAALNGAANGTPNPNQGPIHTTWSLGSTLMPMPPSKGLAKLELPGELRDTLQEILDEWRQRDKLTTHELPRRWRLLFHGPSGCGKSATAAALAFEIGLPGYIVRFDSLIGAYLGQTALRLRELFRFVEQAPCILLFDEVDALAKRRGSPMEVGELDRIVIAFMQELEHAQGEGLVIATSNIPKALDDALWRRFDLRVTFPRPNAEALLRFAERRCHDFGLTPATRTLADCRKSGSYAVAEQVVISEARRRLLAR
jgi:hypothetical protein